MDVVQTHNDKSADDNQDGPTYQNYVLRIWKVGKDDFKGYVLDPLTGVTYPLLTTPHEVSTEASIVSVSKQALIKPLGCWIMLLKRIQQGNEPD